MKNINDFSNKTFFQMITMTATILHLEKILVEVTAMVRISTNYFKNNIIDSLCMSWYTGDTTGSDDSKKSENNSEKNSRLAMSNRSGSNFSRSHNSTVGCATGSQIGN